MSDPGSSSGDPPPPPPQAGAWTRAGLFLAGHKEKVPAPFSRPCGLGAQASAGSGPDWAAWNPLGFLPPAASRRKPAQTHRPHGGRQLVRSSGLRAGSSHSGRAPSLSPPPHHPPGPGRLLHSNQGLIKHPLGRRVKSGPHETQAFICEPAIPSPTAHRLLDNKRPLPGRLVLARLGDLETGRVACLTVN